MLFDLEDYSNAGIIAADWDNIMDLIDNGTLNINGDTVYGVNTWGDQQYIFADWATTQRATRDAYLKAVNEYYLSARVMRPDRFVDFELWNIQWNDALIEYGPTAYYFWSALLSIPYLGGRNGGEVAAKISISGSLPGYNDGIRVMTQEIYDAYYSKLAVLGSLVKQLIELAEDSTIVTQ